ncbi:RNA pol II transcription cofactor [Thecaphora frezii]
MPSTVQSPQPSSSKASTASTATSSSSLLAATLAVAVLIASIILFPRLSTRLLARPPTSLSRTMATTTSTAPISRSVAKTVASIETAEGDGAVVRRSIGTPSLRNISPFLMLDHFRIAEHAGFPDHPHRGMTTVTYLLEGKVQHEDFAGHAGTISPGDVQWMNAGKGIMHAEMPVHRDAEGNKLDDPIGLQLWVDLPAPAKKEPPEYQEYKGETLPTVKPRASEPVETEGQGWTAKVVAGHSHGVRSPIELPQNGGVLYIDVRLEGKGRIFQEIPQGYNAFLYTLSGKIRIGEQGPGASVYERYHTMVLSNDTTSGASGVWVENASEDKEDEARFILVAGEPLTQGVVQYGPFVMTNRAEIQQTLLDFQFGANGFERAPGWKSKIGGR